MKRRNFLQLLPFAVSSSVIVNTDGNKEVIFTMPTNTKKFNGGSHKYLREDRKLPGEIFLPAGVWRMTEIRFVKLT